MSELEFRSTLAARFRELETNSSSNGESHGHGIIQIETVAPVANVSSGHFSRLESERHYLYCSALGTYILKAKERG